MADESFTPSEWPRNDTELNGLMLTGGGARAAYQVGVLEAIAQLRRECGQQHGPNPFPIIGGTSAGAINAASLACGADQFERTVGIISNVWRNFHADQVYRADSLSMFRTGAKWATLLSLGWLIAKWRRVKPKSLLDNSPLAELLHTMVPLERLPGLVEKGHLHALAVTASSYSTGEHITFFDGRDGLKPWTRSQRRGLRTPISHTHLLASSAIPFVFPAMPLELSGVTSYFGDGSMRQSAPIAPAIHLGARRILVVGAGRLHEPKGDGAMPTAGQYPSVAQIAGHALANIFLDALSVDVERIRRINQTLSLVPPELRNASNLRPVDLLVVSPSQRLDSIAAEHIDELPSAVRSLLDGVGVSAETANGKGSALASYLLFEPGYTNALITLGHDDTMRQRAEVCRFFGWSDPTVPATQAPDTAHLPQTPQTDRRRDPLRLR